MQRRERGLRSRLAIGLAVSSAYAGGAALAASRFYVGNEGNWNTTASWSATSGGTSGASFPANNDVATINATASLTVPLDRNYAVPGLARNTHRITAEGEFGSLTIEVRNVPTENPRTGRLSYLSTIALLRDLGATLRVGT